MLYGIIRLPKATWYRGGSENYYGIHIQHFPTTVLLYPFALIVFSLCFGFHALIICCTVLWKYFPPLFYSSLPRQFNLHVQYLERVLPLLSLFPLSLHFHKTETKGRTVVYVSDDGWSRCCNFCNETFSPIVHTKRAVSLALFYQPLLGTRRSFPQPLHLFELCIRRKR